MVLGSECKIIIIINMIPIYRGPATGWETTCIQGNDGDGIHRMALLSLSFFCVHHSRIRLIASVSYFCTLEYKGGFHVLRDTGFAWYRELAG